MDLPCYLLSQRKQRNNLSYKLVVTSQTITQLIIEVLLIQTYYWGYLPHWHGQIKPCNSSSSPPRTLALLYVHRRRWRSPLLKGKMAGEALELNKYFFRDTSRYPGSPSERISLMMESSPADLDPSLPAPAAPITIQPWNISSSIEKY